MNRLAEQVDMMLVLCQRLFRLGGADVDELRLAKPERYVCACVCLDVWPGRCTAPSGRLFTRGIVTTNTCLKKVVRLALLK
jgi:hypothetical protein